MNGIYEQILYTLNICLYIGILKKNEASCWDIAFVDGNKKTTAKLCIKE